MIQTQEPQLTSVQASGPQRAALEWMIHNWEIKQDSSGKLEVRALEHTDCGDSVIRKHNLIMNNEENK